MTTLPSNRSARALMVLLAIVAWCGLLLSFDLALHNSIAAGTAMTEAIVNYFSFFTILTNLLVALGLSASLWMWNSSWSSFFSRPATTAGTAIYIAIVGLGYSLLLRHQWNPEGLQLLGDVLLHDVVPVVYVAYWLIFAPKAALHWKSILWWLIYPLVYLLYVLARGALSGRYPYPFIDARALGYPRVFSNAAMLLCTFLGISVLAVVISRWRARKKPASNR